MAGPILYSTNPQIAHHIAVTYRSGGHVIWASEWFDPMVVASTAPATLVGRSSSPKDIFDELSRDCHAEDWHSPHLKRYRKKFRSLSKEWLTSAEIDNQQYEEIEGLLKPGSWNIWRPLLYVIPRDAIEASGRLHLASPSSRATHEREYQIIDLLPAEFDILKWVPR